MFEDNLISISPDPTGSERILIHVCPEVAKFEIRSDPIDPESRFNFSLFRMTIATDLKKTTNECLVFKACNLTKNELLHRYFSRIWTKSLRTPFLQNTSWWLLLTLSLPATSSRKRSRVCVTRVPGVTQSCSIWKNRKETKITAWNSKLSESDKIRYEEIIGVYLRYTPIIPSYRILSESDNLEFHAVD